MDDPTKDDRREKEIAEIKKMIREQRAKLNPEVLAIAERAAKLSQNIPLNEEKNVPYDRANATKAIEAFLKGHSDPKAFQTKLFALLKKGDK